MASNQHLHFIDASAMKMRDPIDTENPPNIDISFASRAHGCMEALDGPGGIGKYLNESVCYIFSCSHRILTSWSYTLKFLITCKVSHSTF
jgi:hypothetical protein